MTSPLFSPRRGRTPFVLAAALAQPQAVDALHPTARVGRTGWAAMPESWSKKISPAVPYSSR